VTQTRSIRFDADTAHLASVRDFAVAAAREFGSDVDIDVLAVVVGELAANAVVHQSHEAELEITALPGGGVRISVCDPDAGMPRMGDGEPWDVTGHRGLQLVEALSAEWGVDPMDRGKRVWADLQPDQEQANAGD
jgi:anti-sigma regulatory factor (Ser/Thr protein kinase)